MPYDVCDALRVKVRISRWRTLRMAKKGVITLAVATQFAVADVSAVLARENVNLTIYGVGAYPCASWSSARQMLSVTGTPSSLAWEQMGWVLGYMTSFGQYALPPGAASPVGIAVVGELDSYCAQHPDELLAIAVSQVATLVAGRQLQATGP
jgi:hypothetical protein